MAKRVLIIFAHPAMEKSRVNARLINALNGISGVTLNPLYDRYCDFHIDVAAEQQRLREADVVVMQHPLFWYSCPALLKEWMDRVLTYNFAYGPKGNALSGKALMSVLTAGGLESNYCPEGAHQRSLRAFLTPFEQTARFCRMRYLPPFAVFGARRLSEVQLAQATERYTALLRALVDDRIQDDAALLAPCFSDDLIRT